MNTLLQANENDLPQLLGDILNYGCRHNQEDEIVHEFGVLRERNSVCSKCGQFVIKTLHRRSDGHILWDKVNLEPCPIADPIDIYDWNVAMTYFRLANPTRDEIIEVFIHEVTWVMQDDERYYNLVALEGLPKDKIAKIAEHWFVRQARAKYYLIAAALTKQKE